MKHSYPLGLDMFGYQNVQTVLELSNHIRAYKVDRNRIEPHSDVIYVLL